MNNKYKSFVLALSLAATGLIVSGCGPKMDMEMEATQDAKIEEALNAANKAEYMARQAQDLAGEALSKASMMGGHGDKMMKDMMK